MYLFKRLLLSLFPDDIITQNINPASMFISFVSAKDFFSIINRKIVENYRINLFDVALDSFELKVGFGEKPFLKSKKMDLYYGYCALANLNGYRFMNPANLANMVALVTSVYMKESFEEEEEKYFVHFLYSVYLLSFVFVSRIKVFPDTTEKGQFNRFVELLFNFYRFVLQESAQEIDGDIFNILKKNIIGQADVLFMLFRFYQRMNTIFEDTQHNKVDFYS
ncbi:MAG: hypothetical protein GXP45_00465, partial [bacterium]|nr:hypothetical protein [bacterium]